MTPVHCPVKMVSAQASHNRDRSEIAPLELPVLALPVSATAIAGDAMAMTAAPNTTAIRRFTLYSSSIPSNTFRTRR